MWVCLFVIMLVIELLTVNLVSIWFAVGSFASYITTYITDNFMIQLIVFIIVSVISLFLTKPIVLKLRKKSIVPTNLDMVIGKIGIVTSVVTNLSPGEVKVSGKRWSAISDKEIDIGKKVEVLSIDGVKLLVKEINEREED